MATEGMATEHKHGIQGMSLHYVEGVEIEKIKTLVCEDLPDSFTRTININHAGGTFSIVLFADERDPLGL